MPLDEAVLDFVLPDDDLAAIRSQYGPVELPPRGDAIEDVIKSGRETVSDFWPLDAPGMPLPGPDMIQLARNLGGTVTITGKGKKAKLTEYDDVLTNLYREMLYSAGDIHIPISLDTHHRKRLCVVSGGSWLTDGPPGPHKADVMIVSKMLGEEERNLGRNMVGESGQLMQEVVEKLRLAGFESWYVTNIMKTEHPQAETGNTTLKASWVAEFSMLLQQELRIVQPKFILCVGADALKAVLGKKATLKNMVGRVVELTYPLNKGQIEIPKEPDDPQGELFPEPAPEPEPPPVAEAEPPKRRRRIIMEQTADVVPTGEYLPGPLVEHTALVMACMHPAYILRQPELEQAFENELARFGQLIKGFRPDLPESDIDHRQIDSLEQLEALFYEIEEDCYKNRISIDAEWHGEHPQNENAYIRSIQLSWRPKKAVFIHITHPGGAWRFRGSKEDLCLWLNKICKGKRIVGQFLAADFEWLIPFGLDLREDFAVAGTWQETVQQAMFSQDESPFAKPKGGFDTGLALHAFDETGDFALTAQTLRFTSAPRYDLALIAWRDKYCNEHNLKKEHLEGYGFCPNEVLVPYGCYDVDIPMRLVDLYEDMLTCDQFGNSSWEAYWISMRAQPAIMEMQETGILIDRKRVDRLSDTYMAAKDRLAKEIRNFAKWETLNLESTFQIREFLFGEEFNGKKRENPDIPMRIRPKGAKSLYLKPAITTDKRPMRWENVVKQGLTKQKSPSTNKTSLAILSQDNEKVERWNEKLQRNVVYDLGKWVARLRDYRFVSQVMKSVLRTPDSNDDGEFITASAGEDGDFYIYPGGLPRAICSDGRVRTRIWPTKETRRWSTTNPPLQNWCFDAATEILTTRGWIKFPDLRAEDEVAQYWSDSGSIDFTRPDELHSSRFRGEMVHLTGEQLDLLVTPNHRCPLVRRRTGEFRVFAAEDLPIGKEWNQLHGGQFAGGDTQVPEDRVRWLVAVQADGSYVGGFDGHGIVFNLTKLRKQKRLRSLLQKLLGDPQSGRWTESQQEFSYRKSRVAFYVGTTDPAARELVAWTKSVMGPRKAYGSWLLQWSRPSLDVLLTELHWWDGLSTRQSEYSSSVEENADWIQAIWALSAVRARKRLYRPKNENAGDHYCVNVPIPARRRNFTSIKKAKLSREAADETVYCVSVPSSHVVVRRNGKVAVSGNSNKRESDYFRILGDMYREPIRSMAVAPPGHVLLSVDYLGAELLGMAILANCPKMIDHATRAALPEDDPNFYDIHSNVAVAAFNLACTPTKNGLKNAGFVHLRIAAKSVVFGVGYGRAAKAIALALREENVDITEEQAQRIIDAIFEEYPELKPFFEACRRRALQQRWMCGVMGGMRRFPIPRDFKTEGDIERQGMNFMVQNLVAEAVNRACDHLITYRREHPEVKYRMNLQLHDALLLEVPYESVEVVQKTVLPLCMCELVPIYPCDFNGMWNGNGPYHLGIDVEPHLAWGELMLPHEFMRAGLDPALSNWVERADGWWHPSKDKKLWVGDAKGGTWQKLQT